MRKKDNLKFLLLPVGLILNSCLEQTTIQSPQTVSSSSVSSVSSSPSSSSSSSSAAPPTPLALGTVTSITPETCQGFYTGMTCYSGTVNCSGTDPLTAHWGSVSPSSGPIKGTVFMHDGAGGTAAFNAGQGANTYAGDLLAAKYRVVQVKWESMWEDTGGSNAKSSKVAACRVATVLDYIYNDTTHGGHGGSTQTGGMCAIGFSGGGGGLAYALTWYGADAFLDKLTVLVGPVFSDIEQGCKVPVGSVNVCPPGQFGCNGTNLNRSMSLSYGQNANLVRNFTGDGTCAGPSPTSANSENAWKNMSILDGTTTSAYFQHPKTAIAGWECGSDANGGNPNASAPLGQLFWANFTSASQTAAYSVNIVDGCGMAENIWSGTINGASAYTASVNDILDSTTGCKKRH